MFITHYLYLSGRRASSNAPSGSGRVSIHDLFGADPVFARDVSGQGGATDQVAGGVGDPQIHDGGAPEVHQASVGRGRGRGRMRGVRQSITTRGGQQARDGIKRKILKMIADYIFYRTKRQYQIWTFWQFCTLGIRTHFHP